MPRRAARTLRPPPGVYAGPATITRPMVLDGGGKVTLDGGDKGTVLTLQTAGAVVRGMRIIRFGDSHDQMDAAILVQGDANLIEHNTLEDVLFGVVFKQSNDNRLRPTASVRAMTNWPGVAMPSACGTAGGT